MSCSLVESKSFSSPLGELELYQKWVLTHNQFEAIQIYNWQNFVFEFQFVLSVSEQKPLSKAKATVISQYLLRVTHLDHSCQSEERALPILRRAKDSLHTLCREPRFHLKVLSTSRLALRFDTILRS